MGSDHVDVSGQIRWINSAKRCHDGDGRQIQQLVSRNGGVNMLEKAPEEGIGLTRGPSCMVSLISSQDRDDTEVLGWSEGKGRISNIGEVVSDDSKVRTCDGSNAKDSRTRGPRELRKDLSSIAQELLELRLHMIKEEERFRRQEQNHLLKEGLRYKTQTKGAQPEVWTEHEKSKSQREQRRKQRSPLRNQTNLIIDDLKRKVCSLLKQRKEMREQDRLLRLQLDEIRAQWEESVRQVEQARIENAKIMNKIASITS